MSVLSDFVEKIPIKNGDVVLFSSDSLRLNVYMKKNNEELDFHKLLDLLIEKIGVNGTLLLPTYNWDFCRGETFDYLNTPSKTGAISQAALSHPAFKRTKHPLYSWAVTGKDKEYLCSLNNNDSFGKDSPFNYLYERKAKNVILDVTMQNCFTYVHYVEECIGVPYRYLKKFTGEYIDEKGKEENKTISMYVRDYDLEAEASLEQLERFLLKEKIIDETFIGYSRVLCIPLFETYDVIKNDIIYNKAKKIATYKGQYDSEE